MERCNNVGLDKESVLESNKALKTLYKEHNVSIVDVLLYKNDLAFSVCSIEIEVKVA